MSDPRFFLNKGPFTAKQIAERTNSQVIGNEAVLVHNIATLSAAKNGDISFFSNKKYVSDLRNTRASVCICSKEFVETAPEGCILIVNDNPYYAYAEVTHMFFDSAIPKHFIADSSKVNASVKIKDATVGEFSIIAEGAEIGSNVTIGNNVSIGEGVVIGEGTVIKDNVTITHAIIGKNCLIYTGSRIGQDGFGFAPSANGIKKVLQLGRVIIEDNVEVGANTTIDRGAIEDTLIGAGTKIDNLVQIGHNVHVGKNCFIVAQAAIAGSCEIGDHVMIGGQVGIAGHLKVGNNVMIAGQSGVISDIEAKSVVGG